jgi:alpha-tubulin suppressor-like RCC1 family protein
LAIRSLRSLQQGRARLVLVGLVLVVIGAGVVAVTLSGSSTSKSRALRGWGDNSRGEIGNDSFVGQPTPVEVSLPGRPIAVSAGGDHTLALVAGSTPASNAVYAWGDNTYGQLGNNLIPPANTGLRKEFPLDSRRPVRVLDGGTGKGLSNVASIAAGSSFSLALLNDGTVRAWGSNEFGQLGNPNNRTFLKPADAYRAIPVVKSLDGTLLGDGSNKVVAIAAGGFHAVALLRDGRVMAWGKNNHGQLGTGSNALCASQGKPNDRTTPCSGLPTRTAAGSSPCGVSSVTSLAAGTFQTFALCADHTVWAWGANGVGQLGLGAGVTDDRAVPTRVPGISNAVGLASGGFHSLALTSTGAVLAWGANDVGQLGNGSAVPSGVPMQALRAGAAAVVAGYQHSLVLLCDRTVRAWGANEFGELGNPNASRGSNPQGSTQPIAVVNLVGVVGRQGLSASDYDSFAVTGGRGSLC